MTTIERYDLYIQVIGRFGKSGQINKAVEELAELIQAIAKRGSLIAAGHLDEANTELDHIAEEMADVEIMLEQLMLIYDNADKVAEWKEKKLDRLKGRLK